MSGAGRRPVTSAGVAAGPGEARRRSPRNVMGRGTEDASNEEPSRQEEEAPAVMRADAATKIQAGFRGYKVRKQLRKQRRDRDREVQPPAGSLEERSATTIQAGVRGFLVRRRHQQEQRAATKIQAGFRGFKARRAAKSRAQLPK